MLELTLVRGFTKVDTNCYRLFGFNLETKLNYYIYDYFISLPKFEMRFKRYKKGITAC